MRFLTKNPRLPEIFFGEMYFWTKDYSFENKQMLLIASKVQLDLSTGIDHVSV